ncbi:NUDIX domain-containing protein [Candidatus Dojkabacteria bacterium]|nr:NUDIX domain-containing protein [Candidatus Dojkabacteria bacterium]
MDTKNFREDKDSRIQNERHAGIVLKDSKILLVFRIKDGYKYYVLPGGHRREDEKKEETVIREIREETGIEVAEPELMFEFRNYKNKNLDFYYLCKWRAGEEPFLDGEEAIRNSDENFFEPMWVDLNAISEKNILPKFAKEWLEMNLVWLKSE